jgi:hypothetical protein
MKYNSILLPLQKTLLMAAVLSVGLMTACKKDNHSPTPVQKATQILTANDGTWTPPATGGVTIEGIDVTQDLFSGFSITFAEGSFTTTGTSPVWLRQDTWRFKDETATVILRGQDDKEITLTEITATQVKLTIEWDQTTTEGGRSKSLKGKHEFTLNK